MNFSMLVIIFILIFSTIAILVYKNMLKGWVDPRAVRRQQLGFTQLDPLPNEIVSRIRKLRPETKEMRVTHISCKKTLDGDLYLYDAVIPTKIDNDDYLEDRLIVISKLWHLPYFALFQMPEMDKKLGKIMNGFANNVVGWAYNSVGLQRVHLTTFPKNSNILLLAKDQEQVQVFFNNEHVQVFSSIAQGVKVTAWEDCLEIEAMNSRSRNNDEKLELEIATAIKLLRNLSD